MAVTWTNAARMPSAAYALGDRVTNGGNTYRCTVAGTTGIGAGPTGTGSAITDGTVTWAWLSATSTLYVTGVAPNLSTVGATQAALCLDLADAQIDTTEWGTLADAAAVYLAAHTATMMNSRGLGPIASEGVGPLSRGYGSLLAFGVLGQTSYGIEYLRLLHLLPASLGIVA